MQSKIFQLIGRAKRREAKYWIKNNIVSLEEISILQFEVVYFSFCCLYFGQLANTGNHTSTTFIRIWHAYSCAYSYWGGGFRISRLTTYACRSSAGQFAVNPKSQTHRVIALIARRCLILAASTRDIVLSVITQIS